MVLLMCFINFYGVNDTRINVITLPIALFEKFSSNLTKTFLHLVKFISQLEE